PIESYDSIGLAARSGVGYEMEEVLVVVHVLYHLNGPFWEVAAAAKFALIFLFLLYHEILEYLFKLLFANPHGCIVQVAIDAGEIKEIGNVLPLVFFGQVFPERTTGEIGLLVGKLVEVVVSAGQHGGPEFIVFDRIPAFGYVFDIPVG